MLKSKKYLLEKCSELGIKVAQTTSKEKLIELIEQKEIYEVFHLKHENTNDIKYIYHLADIHIRYIERHEEYSLVFEKLYESIKQEDSIMVICGDIFHNRDRFVSETIVIFDKFLKKLTKILPVFIIAGNHDCFNHSDRMDSISGIVNTVEYDNLHLLKKSGIYNYNNVSFHLGSLLDGKSIPKNQKQNKVNIALYHGIVDGCVLDNGTKPEGGVQVSEYDLVLLGDVHKRQFLNKTKTIAYPGSLIQQSFKEELHHGYLLWDLKKLTSKFVHLENPYSFVDIPINLDLETVKFTQFSRIRLLIENTNTEKEIDECIENIKKYTQVLSIKKILNIQELNVDLENEEIYEKKIGGKEIEIIKKLSADNWEEILKINQEVSREIEYEEKSETESLPWCIYKMDFKNIFSYGGDVLNTIDFKNGVTGILADNASGKTNILNTILYGLFGNIHSRTQNHLNKNIVSRHSVKEDLFVKLYVRFSDGKKYYIERTAKTKTRGRIKSSSAGQVDISETLRFYTDDEILNLSGKTETEKLLRNTLSFKSKDEFILTNMMSNIGYGDNMSIISMNGSQLDDVFNNIFNLDKYRLLHSHSKAKAKEIIEKVKINNTKIEMLKDNLESLDKKQMTTEIKKLTKSIEKCKENIELLKEEIHEIDDKLLQSKKITTVESEKILKRKKQDCDEILNECEDIKAVLRDEEDIKLEYSSLKKQYDKKLLNYPRPNVTINKTQEQIEKEITVLESSRKEIVFNTDFTNEYIKAKKYLSKISKDTLDITSVIQDIKSLKKIKDGYFMPETVYEKITKDLEKTYIDPNTVMKYKQIIQDKEDQDKSTIHNINVDQEVSNLKKLLHNTKVESQYIIRDKLNKYASMLEYIDYYYELQDIKVQLKSLKENKEISMLLTEKTKLVENLNKITLEFNEQDKMLYNLEQKVKQYDDISKNLDEIVPLNNELIHKSKLYKIYVDITHSKNLPKMMISNIIQSICQEANVLIYNTTGLLCYIEENEKWEIVIKKGDLILGPEHCSGYERFILNTSLKLAFDKYKQLSSIQLFLIDETIDCVSESNFDQIDVVLSYLQKHYKNIILISHNEDLKKKIEHRISIEVSNYSKIQKN